MSAFKSLFGLLNRHNEEPVDVEDDVMEGRAPALDIVFDPQIRQEAMLQQLWTQYQIAGQQTPEKEDDALKHFCEEFERTFSDWTPDESALKLAQERDSMTQAQSLSPGRSNLGQAMMGNGWVKGCSGGHPKSVLSVFCSTLKAVPAWGSDKPDHGRGATFWVLEALAIATRSYHNCEILLEMGLLTTLSDVLKVLISSRLTTIVTVLQNEGEATKNVKSQLKSILHSLGQIIGILLQWAATEVRKCGTQKTSPLMRPYVQGNTQFLSLKPIEAGSKLDSEVMREALEPLVETGLVAHALQFFKLQARIASLAPNISNIKTDTRLLEFLLVSISASPQIAASLCDDNPRECTLRAMISNLVCSLSEVSEEKIQDALHRQILLLQVAAAAIKHNTANLHIFLEVGGPEKCFALAHWVSLHARQQPGLAGSQIWPQAPSWAASMPRSMSLTEAEERSSMLASTSGRDPPQRKSSMRRSPSKSTKSVRFSDEASMDLEAALGEIDKSRRRLSTDSQASNDSESCLLGNIGFVGTPRCQALRECFWVLESMLSLKGGRRNSPKEKDLLERLLGSVLEAFAQPSQSINFKQGSSDVTTNILMQQYVVAFLFTVLTTHSEELDRLRTLGYLDLLFSPAFFMYRNPTENAVDLITHADNEEKPSVLDNLVSFAKNLLNQATLVDHYEFPEELTLDEENEAEESKKGQAEDSSPAVTLYWDAILGSAPAEVQRFRLCILQLVRHAACLESREACLQECKKLNEVLKSNKESPEMSALIADCLRAILEARSTAMESFRSVGVMTTIAQTIKVQQQFEDQLQDIMRDLPEQKQNALTSMETYRSLQDARRALLNLLTACLTSGPEAQRQAVRTWDVVAALFSLTYNPQTQGIALQLIVSLMKMVPENENDSLSKVPLFTKFMQLLPAALQNKTPCMRLIRDLLASMREVLTVNCASHQVLFRKAECFIQILHLLNAEHDPAEAESLCCEVLATLTALLANNDVSRSRFKEAVGYDTLLSIILRNISDRQPSEMLLIHLLALVLEDEYRVELPNQKISNVHAVPVFFECVRRAERALQSKMLEIWLRLTGGNMANLAACERASLNTLLIEWLGKAQSEKQLQLEILRILRLAGSFSISAKDLLALLALLRPSENGNLPQHYLMLLKSLAIMAQHEGPAAFFDFADDNAGLMRTVPLKLPTSKGYTFATWMRLEKITFRTSTAGQSLFCFLSQAGEGRGVIATIQGDKMQIMCKAPKFIEVEFDFVFEAKKWYHIVVTHSTGANVQPSMVRLFVNGALVDSHRFRYPKTSELFGECSFGARLSAQESQMGKPIAPFHGQLGCIYLFQDIFSKGRVQALCELGPDYQSTFLASEFDPAFEQAATAAASLIEGKNPVSSLLILSYNAQAAAGKMLYETSGMDKGSDEFGTAAMLEGTRLCCTCQLREILHCLGGVSVLLPLFSHLDLTVGEGQQGGPQIAVQTVNLLTAVLFGSPANRQNFSNVSGMGIVAHLLLQSKAEHLTVELLGAIEKLCHAVKPSDSLWLDALNFLLLNFQLWSRADMKTQRSHLKTLAKLAKDSPRVFAHVLGVPKLLDVVKAYYWVAPGSTDAERPYAGLGKLSEAEIVELRTSVLQIARVLMQNSILNGTWRSERSWADVQAFVSFVGDCPEVGMLEDVLSAFQHALRHGSASHWEMKTCLNAHGGARLFLSLLQREEQSLRLLGLQLIAAFQGPDDLQPGITSPGNAELTGDLEDMKDSGFWASVYDLLSMFPFTQKERVNLLEMLCIGSKPTQGMGSRGQAVPTIGAPPVFPILLRLIKSCRNSSEVTATLEALHYLIVDGPETNRASVMRLPGCDEVLLELLMEGSSILSDREQHGNSLSSYPTPPRASSESQRSASAQGNERGVAVGDHQWSWQGKEMGLVRDMLRVLLVHTTSHSEDGWMRLEHISLFLKKRQAQGQVNGWSLMIALLRDLVEGLMKGDGVSTPRRQSNSETWDLVDNFAANPLQRNSIHILSIFNQMASGVIIQPEDDASRPSFEAVQWAEKGADEAVPGHVWRTLGLQVANDTAGEAVQKLQEPAWKLVAALQKALDTPHFQNNPNDSWLSRTLPAAAALSLPLGLEKHLTPLPFLAGAEARRQAEEESKAKFKFEAAHLTGALLCNALSVEPMDQAGSALRNATQLLTHALDPKIPSIRQDLGVLVGSLLHQLELSISNQRDASRQNLIAKAVSVVLRCAHPIFAADEVSPVYLPDPEDPAFQIGVEGVRKQLQITKACQAEILRLSGLANSHTTAQSLLEAKKMSKASTEKQLRQNLQEDTRKVLGLIHNSEKSRRSTAKHNRRESVHNMSRSWRNMRRSLFSTGGLWSNSEATVDVHWKLDKIEDSSRRRLKLKRNFKFEAYQQPSKASPKPAKPEQPLVVPGLKVRLPSEQMDAAQELASPSTLTRDESGPESSTSSLQQRLSTARSMATTDEDDLARSESLGEDSKVVFSAGCKLVTPKAVTAGHINITASHIIFSSQAPEGATPKGKGSEMLYKKWQVASIVEVHHARFLLRPFALELFLSNRYTAMISFDSSKIAMEVAGHLQGLNSNILIYDRRRKMDLAQRLQAKWQRWEISNFDYIMQLNTLAGRTYNDLNQYPVFPWTIADYKSESLDLCSPATFRDFSKPVGALDEKRLAGFKERFESLKADPETPPFHYGTHYSSAAIVLFYLIRMEPFTMLNRNLQGGRFDHADRLFGGVAETWENSLHNTADVKELIPEFFYQPEFLLNSNQFDFGSRQDGAQINDVRLPAWANGSADEFVRLNREALESDYVSEHLHEWLDLIFGVTQSGPAAVAASNVFYYLTYEGAVDVDSIVDPVQRKAVEDQISLFGQTPSQLFRRRHGKKAAPPTPSQNPLLNGPDTMKLTVVGRPSVKRPDNAVAELYLSEGRAILINSDRTVSCHRWLTPKDLPAFTFTGNTEATFNVEADATPPRLLGTPFAADFDRSKCFSVLPGGQIVVCCGYWDNSVRAYGVDDGALLQAVKQHKDIVTCIATSPDGICLVSGSRDTTVIVWDVRSCSRETKGRNKAPAVLPLDHVPAHVLSGHSDTVICVAVSSDLDIIISASANGEILFHLMGTGRLVRSLKLPDRVPADLIAIAPLSATVIFSSSQDFSLHTYTINARHLESSAGSEKILALAVSPDCRFLLTGSAKGFISLRHIHSLQVVLRYEPAKGSVTALAVTPEECILGGTSDGSLLVFAPDQRRTIRKRNDFASKEKKSSLTGKGAAGVQTVKFESQPE